MCVCVQVKKGLDKLFRRVEREVSEEVLEVVWGDMQSCFMQQVARFHSLIQDCYPGLLIISLSAPYIHTHTQALG